MRRATPLPEGTIPVAAGLVVAGLSAYGFLTVASHALVSTAGHGVDRSHYSPVATFWTILFICGPGLFIPLEQEVARALAARRIRGLGGRPLVIRAATGGAILTAAITAIALLTAGPLTARLFGGDGLLLAALIVGLIAYCFEFIARGVLAGYGRFTRYGFIFAAEGVLRVGGAGFLALMGVREPGAYGLVLSLASALATAVAVVGQRALLTPGPPAPWGELSTALGFLLATSLLTQALLNAGVLAVALLAPPGEGAAAGIFLNNLVIARVPLFFFQAVQAALLPKLARLAAAGHEREFRVTLIRLLFFTATLAAAATAGAALLGPRVVGLLFGSGFALPHADLGLLAAASGGFMLAIALTQALISLRAYWRSTLGWMAGCTSFTAVTVTAGGVYRRAELGLAAGSAAAIGVMAALLTLRLRSGAGPRQP